MLKKMKVPKIILASLLCLVAASALLAGSTSLPVKKGAVVLNKLTIPVYTGIKSVNKLSNPMGEGIEFKLSKKTDKDAIAEVEKLKKFYTGKKIDKFAIPAFTQAMVPTNWLSGSGACEPGKGITVTIIRDGKNISVNVMNSFCPY